MVRILLVAVPPLIGNIMLQMLPDDMQVESVTRYDGSIEPTLAASGLPADIAFVGPNGRADQLAAELVATGRALKVIALSADGRSARIHRSGGAAKMLEDLSLQDLRAMLSDWLVPS